MTAVTLSTTTMVTIGAIFLFIMVFTIARKTLSTVLWGLFISVVVVAILQATTGNQLVDLMELGNFILYQIVRFFYWVQDTFWPRLADAATEIGNAAG